jgi:uncharacterized OB-fold protein
VSQLRAGVGERRAYNISTIELNEGIRMWSNVSGCPPEQVKAGDRVAITYEDATGDISLPKFKLTA